MNIEWKDRFEIVATDESGNEIGQILLSEADGDNVYIDTIIGTEDVRKELIDFLNKEAKNEKFKILNEKNVLTSAKKQKSTYKKIRIYNKIGVICTQCKKTVLRGRKAEGVCYICRPKNRWGYY